MPIRCRSTPCTGTSPGPTRPLTKKAGRKTNPAMAAGVADHVWSVREIAGLLDGA